MQVESVVNHADDSSQTSGDKDAKKKIVAAVLLAVLLGVVIFQPEPETEEVASAQSQPELAIIAQPTAEATASNDVPQAFLATRQLSRVNVEQVADTALFHADKLPSRQAAQRGPLRVQAVYGSGQSQSAIVSGSIIRQGQPLPDGRKVIDVSDEGIEISR